MFALPCAGKLGNCPKTVNRFRFTCLFCRDRREEYTDYQRPSFWIEYTWKSLIRVFFTKRFVKGNLEYTSRSGKLLKITERMKLKIDPRGHFTSLRCAGISVLDSIMLATRIRKPLVEFAEFLACYPTL